MKTLFVILFVVFCNVNSGNAQWKFRAIAGPQLANFGGSDKKEWGGTLSNPELVFRFHAGLLADRNLTETLSFSTGLMLSSKGAKYDGGQYDPSAQFYTYSYIKKISYLDIPMILNYALSKKWSIGLGPQVSILMSAKVKNDENSQKIYGLPETEDVKDYYSALDVGLNAGITYALNERLALQLFYQHGLTKIGQDQVDTGTGGTTEETASVMNRVARLSVLYSFNKK